MPKAQPDPSLELRPRQRPPRGSEFSYKTVIRLWKEGKIERVRFGSQTRITARSLKPLVDLLDTLNPGDDSE